MADHAVVPDALPRDGLEHRLHPLSWLFVLIASLKQFILPLLALLLAGRGDRHDLWGLLAVGALVATSLLQYLTYRYSLRGDGIVIRSGWLHRSLREIPFARIHNVDLHQSLLHRLAGVAEVRLESAGGNKPEAQMRVLRMDQALALEALVRQRGQAATAPDAGHEAPPLLALPVGELVRLGLIDNRGMLLVAAAFGALAQAGENLFGALVERWGRVAFGWWSQQFGSALRDTWPGTLLAAASLLVLAVLAIRLLSVALAVLQFHGFTLREQDGRITVERGLLARSRASARRRRIQAWALHEGVLHRVFGRRSLRVQTAAGRGDQQERRHGLKELAPIAPPAACDALIRHFLPDAGWGALDWQPLHPRAWWRVALPGSLLLLVATGVLCWRFGAWGAVALLLVPAQLWRARRIARACGWACNGRLVAWRTGWLARRWDFAEMGKLQALRLTQSPLDRRLGMAGLLLDTAGAAPFGAPLHLRHLPLDAARALSARVATELARRRLQW